MQLHLPEVIRASTMATPQRWRCLPNRPSEFFLKTIPHGNATSIQRTNARRSATHRAVWRKARRNYTATNGGVTTMMECRGIVEELLSEGTSKAVTPRHRLVHQNCICKLSEQRRDSMACKLISLQPECIRRKPLAHKVLPTTFVCGLLPRERSPSAPCNRQCGHATSPRERVEEA